MKRMFAGALIALMVLMLGCAPALAFSGKGYPAWDGSSVPKEAACGSFGGEKLMLAFDPSPEYSTEENGFAQACFFAFDESGDNYLELFLTLPMAVSAGDVLSSGDPACAGASLYLFDTTRTDETVYCAEQMMESVYPSGARFEIRISEVRYTAVGFFMHGTLDGELCRADAFPPSGKTLMLSGVEFDFTIPIGGAPSQDGGFSLPVPKFTLPPDYAVI